MRFQAILAAALFSVSGASAQTEGAAAPPCADDIYHAFDFWLGEWEVTADGKFAGTNKISSQEGGCLILEEWTGASGGSGQSYNYYDPGLGKWRQIWVSGFGTIDYAGGLNDAGEMVLEGEIAYRNGKTAPFKGVWTLNDDATVTQHFTQYNADTSKWDDWFVGVYKKQ